jgi:hypothetical protein
MYNGVGALTRESPDVARLRHALTVWAGQPNDRAAINGLYEAAWLWTAKVRPRFTALDNALASALVQWGKSPSDASSQRLVSAAAARWKAGTHALGEYFSGTGEYFAAAGMGEYFSGTGEYFSGADGLGAEITMVCSEECMKYVKADKKRLVLMTGAIALGAGLFAGMVVFR